MTRIRCYYAVVKLGDETPRESEIVMGLVQVMEGRPRLRPGGYAGLAASSRPHSRMYFGHAEAWPSTVIKETSNGTILMLE